ncbi:MAG: SH3 domain-containing protein [Acidobacteriia bacterium]|nr:SH3 domain-containing protein [Terriglobia bacterium]
MGYVLPETAAVFDSPAEIRLGVATLAQGDRVEILKRTAHWAQVRMADGRSGWLEAEALLNGATYNRGRQLWLNIQKEQPQATGHPAGAANLRAEPSREAPQIGQLAANQRVEIFDRRLVDRTPQPEAPAAEPVRDVWYLVRAGRQSGWVLGRLISLDVPAAISGYVQSFNMVAWLVLDTVQDGDRHVPQYLVADRIGTQEFDFNHIRVFTWWSKRQEYVTAYVESNLEGHFPIRVRQIDGVPYFRLRLVDENGAKFQKVYRLNDTIVRPVGTVEGWESDAMPSRQVHAAYRRRR